MPLLALPLVALVAAAGVDSTGRARTLIDDLRVSDVAVVGPRTLVGSAVEPGSLWRLDARTGAHTRLAGR